MTNSNKTIFLVIHQGFEARYLLRTNILKELKKHIDKIVILTPNADEEYFIKEFKKDNVLIEQFEDEKCEAHIKKARGLRLFRLLRSFVLNGKYNLTTVKDHFKIYLEENPPQNLYQKLKLALMKASIQGLRSSKILRHFLVWMEGKMYSPNFHKELFEQHSPNLVITTTLGNMGNGHDAFILREAKRFGAKTISIILSWDNTTGKGLGAAYPDFIIAWTEKMKKELIEYQDFPEKNIFVGGIAHFDIYYNKNLFLQKEELFKKFNLDPERKLILFATKSPSSYPWNIDVAQIIAEAIQNQTIPFPSQLLIRLHPLHFVVKKSQKKNIQSVDEFHDLVKKYSFVKLDKPEILSDRLTMDMPEFEQVKLASLLNQSDVLVNILSTLNIEASILNIPSVNVGFEGDPERKKNGRQSIKIDLRQVHNQRIMSYDALKICYTSEELIKSINHSLNNSSIAKGSMVQLVENEAGPFKGNAGKQIASIILSL